MVRARLVAELGPATASCDGSAARPGRGRDRRAKLVRRAAHLRLPGDRATARAATRDAPRGGGGGDRRRASSSSTSSRWSTGYVGARSEAALGRPLDLGARRPRAAEHPGPGARPRRLAARQPARRAAARHQQPLRGGGRLRHHGRRHLRRAVARSPASTRPFLRRWLRWLETAGAGGAEPDSGAGGGDRPGARPPSCGRPSARQTDEADLMPYDAARRHRARRDPRQAVAARGLPAAARPRFPSTRPSSWPPGSSASSGFGAATSGSASATRPRSTSTTRTSTPRPGAASRSSRAASSGSSRSCGGRWGRS